MLITVVVESMYLGPASGFTQIVVDDSEPVQSIIDRFCDIKRAPVDPLFSIISDSNVSFEGTRKICDLGIQDNDHVRLGRRREPANMFQFVSWFRVAILGTLLGLLGLISVIVAYILLRQVPYKFGIIFDAGSTHTDVTVYQWPGAKYHNTGQIAQVVNCSMQKEGIADISRNNVSTYLERCLSVATSSIQSKSLADTKVFFGATAGMRILQERNSSAVDDILFQVRQSLANSGFVDEYSSVDVISGDREGLSGWISVNLLQNALEGANKTEKIVNSTFGSLDLGGASMQIAVEIEDYDNSSLNPFVHSVSLFDRNYNVYTQSFLCYGVVQAFNRYRAMLIVTQSQNGSLNISSPCEPTGFSYTIKISEVFGVPCAMYPDNKILPAQVDNDTVFTFLGSNDVASCQSNLTFLTSISLCPRLGSPHCLNETTLPTTELLKSKFLAYSAFGHVMADMNMSSVVSKDNFVTKLDRLCSESYDQLIFYRNTFKIPLTLRQIEQLCFEGQYIYILFTKVFNFTTNEDWQRLEFRNEVSGIGLSWSLGFMLNETVYMEPTKSIPEMDVMTFVMLLAVFSLLFILFTLMLFHAVRLNNNIKTYERQFSAYQDKPAKRFSTIHVISRQYDPTG